MDAELKSAIDDVRGFAEKSGARFDELSNRMLAVEQKMTVRGDGGSYAEKSLGQSVVECEQFKSFVSAGTKSSGRIQVGSFFKTALVNATGTGQPLVPAHRIPGIVMPGQVRLTVRDLLPAAPTSSNLIEFPRETSFTNNAGVQGAGSSPQVYENVAKPESAMAFELATAQVHTLAHFIPISRQLLDDGPGLQAYINHRMLYGLKLKEEQELLSGTGVGASLSGLITNATAYETSRNVSGDSKIDTLRHAIAQVMASNYDADAVILNPSDWEAIELTKTAGTSSSGEYIITDPRLTNVKRLWGRAVIDTPSISAGQFLVGAFASAAMIWDRQAAVIEVAREHSDWFTKNVACLLCEERLALTVFRSDALVYGAFPTE